MNKPVFYHAGCTICVEAEQEVAKALNAEIVHLGEQPERISEAEAAGVQSVPAVLLNNGVFHINFGAALADLKA
ncbi:MULTISPECIES: hypothetical protein [unclassified Shewanella]|uniref:hypothetical protein n=1 Tax=unclassified Shewanella TaxID=196818 RepID=UPI001BC1AC13|nr:MULTISPECIES: hypothetical protein [unclassified Shewanella]GIU20671.1 thioredoxin family protein [Shewanella sp. MBTL60-112-B1]GIU40039.1 thioredoxin family protein [Shewanella sp. MBTL60-112-B2]